MERKTNPLEGGVEENVHAPQASVVWSACECEVYILMNLLNSFSRKVTKTLDQMVFAQMKQEVGSYIVTHAIWLQKKLANKNRVCRKTFWFYNFFSPKDQYGLFKKKRAVSYLKIFFLACFVRDIYSSKLGPAKLSSIMVCLGPSSTNHDLNYSDYRPGINIRNLNLYFRSGWGV